MGSELLTTRQAARLLDVAPSTVKRWADEALLPCVRTLGRHRRFQRTEIERFRRAHLGPEPEPAAVEVERWLEVLTGPGESQGVVGALLSERTKLGSWHAVASSLVEVLAEIGTRWRQGRISIPEEHVASERLARGLSFIEQSLPTASTAPSCLLFVAEGEQHTLGLALAELSAREVGYRTKWLGRNTPVAEAARELLQDPPSVVIVSASGHAADGARLQEQYEILRSATAARGVELILGGAGAWPEPLPYGHRLRTFEELSELLSRLGPNRRSAS